MAKARTLEHDFAFWVGWAGSAQVVVVIWWLEGWGPGEFQVFSSLLRWGLGATCLAGPWLHVVFHCSMTYRTPAYLAAGVFRGRKLQDPWRHQLWNTRCHFCVAQNKPQGQLDSRGGEIDPTAWWKDLQNTVAVFFHTATPVLYALQSIPVEKQKLFSAVGLLNQGSKTDCWGLRVIVGMFKHLKLKRFYTKLNPNFFFCLTKWKPWHMRLSSTSHQGAGAK